MAKNCVARLTDDDEALIVLSGLGFCAQDWAFIKRVGALKLLSSDLFASMLHEKMKAEPAFSAIKNLREFLDRFYEQGGYLLTPQDPHVARLFSWPHAPLVFFGHFSRRILGGSKAVAIVGSRIASSKTQSLAVNLAKKLAERGIVVISGGAMGVDTSAHCGALLARGQTVLVSGVVARPERWHVLENAQGFRDENFAVVYPFGPLSPQGKFMFIERNRYISALADAVVVVSGKEGSGTLHTARFAREQNVPVFAIPHALDEPLAYAPHHLLATQKASALVDFTQFADSLVAKPNNPPKKRENVLDDRVMKHQPKGALPYLLEVISNHDNALGFDELLQITGKSFMDLQRELLDYELSGRIVKRGSQFVLTGG